METDASNTGIPPDAGAPGVAFARLSSAAPHLPLAGEPRSPRVICAAAAHDFRASLSLLTTDQLWVSTM